MATATKTAGNGSKSGASSAKEPSIQDLSNQVETLKADIAELLKTSRNLGAAKAREAQGTAQAKAAEWQAEGERLAAEAGRRATEQYDAGIDAIRRQPATSVAIAAGIGFLVGMVMTGRR